MSNIPSDAKLQREYLAKLRETGGEVGRARVLALVGTSDLSRWRKNTDKDAKGHTFEQREMLVMAETRQNIRKKVNEILEATDEDGFPKYPAQIMQIARLQLDELKPPAQQVNHNVRGQVEHRHQHQAVIDAMPQELLQKFIETGESDIEMDRIAEDVWSKK